MDKNSPPEFHASFYGPRYWFTWLGLGFFYLLARFPVPVALVFGRLLGDLFYYLARSRRRICETNIALCFPQLSAQQQAELVRSTLHNTGKSLVEMAIGLWGPAGQLDNRFEIHGLEHLQAQQSQGRGVLLLGGHFTTIDIVGRVLSPYAKYDVLYRQDENPLMDYILAHAREKFAQSAIPRSDTRQLIRHLREGRVVWYAPDQDYGAKHSVFAPFFGVQAASIVGTARIARLGEAAVVPFSHYRDENNCYHLVFEPALENYPTGDDVADATRINQIVEAAVIKHPDQYWWVHRRFKTRPPGEPSLYPKKNRRR